VSKFKPLGNRILVKVEEAVEKQKGGIIIPGNLQENPTEGEVIAVGKGYVTQQGNTIPLDVKEGDRVLYGKFTGTEIKIDDDPFLVLTQDDVLGVLS